MVIKFYKKDKDAIIPTRKHPKDAGLDLYTVTPVFVLKNSYAIVKTGVSTIIPEGYFGLIKPKGSNNHLIGAGVVDENYRGELLVKVFNPTDHMISFGKGEAIAQLVLIPVITPTPVEIFSEPERIIPTDRGSSGGIWGDVNTSESFAENIDIYYINGVD